MEEKKLTDEEVLEALRACSNVEDSCNNNCPNAVVLTGNEYERFQGQTINMKKVRKETAEKFAERVKTAFYYEFEVLIPSIMSDKIDEIAKEIINE